MTPPVSWTADGHPRSPRFDDMYRPHTGALAQAAGAFLAGCGLPERWRGGRPGFTVLETGFGLGLNFLATWAAWAADPERSAALHFVSVEAHPVSADDLRRAEATLNEGMPGPAHPLRNGVRSVAGELAAAWRDFPEGRHPLAFAGGRVRLTLSIGDVRPALEALHDLEPADAVYLDGFSPTLNPDMWSAATLQAVARRCQAGTVLASYSVHRDVRAALQQLGFQVRKRPGVPPKRHRLEAVYAPAGDTDRSAAARHPPPAGAIGPSP